MPNYLAHADFYIASGKEFDLEVESRETIANIKQKIERERCIPFDHQTLIYDGKMLQDGHTSDSYHIIRESRLLLVLNDSLRRSNLNQPASVEIPRESLFPNFDIANANIAAWESSARRGNFDPETHVVDPQAHYTRLDALEEKVVPSSELFRCKGRFPVFDISKISLSDRVNTVSTVDFWIWDIVLDPDIEYPGRPNIAKHLCETYVVVAKVLENFDMLSSHGFCGKFFSILVQHPGTSTAELVKIPRNSVSKFQEALEAAISISSAINTEEYFEDIAAYVNASCEALLGLLRCRTSREKCMDRVLPLYRMLAYVLDVGLVSYCRSHGSRFDRLFLESETGIVAANLGWDFGFDFSIMPLACLNGFLDKKSAWVFRGTAAARTAPKARFHQKLSVLTYIDTFADVWGPVWAQPMDRVEIMCIRKYHVSKGVIFRTRERGECQIPGAIPCHWYNWTEDFRRRASRLIPGHEDIPFFVHDRLLIGTKLRENYECKFNQRDLESKFGDRMTALGPNPSTWRLDSAGYAFQFAAPKLLTFQIQGKAKKMPETTVKQFIWDRWSSGDAARANLGILNNFLGVEVSECTGNARRVALKHVFLMPSVRPLLDRRIPGWRTTAWGLSFQRALVSESHQEIFSFWDKYYDQRAEVGKLVNCVLDVLKSTGWIDDGFQVALINRHEEFGINLDLDTNGWATILKDTYKTATYALLERVCLECERADHAASTCQNGFAFTVLQSQVGMMKGGSETRRLRVEPHHQTFKLFDSDGSGRAFFKPESKFSGMLKLGRGIGVGREVLDPSRQPRNETINAIFCAASPSHGGLRIARVPHSSNNTIEVVPEASQPLPVRASPGALVPSRVAEVVEGGQRAISAQEILDQLRGS